MWCAGGAGEGGEDALIHTSHKTNTLSGGGVGGVQSLSNTLSGCVVGVGLSVGLSGCVGLALRLSVGLSGCIVHLVPGLVDGQIPPGGGGGGCTPRG